jgi:predicted permease
VQLALIVAAAAVVCAAQAAAIAVFRATRNVDEQDPPPQGRLHFFSIAAMLGNTLFLGAILLSGVATIVDRACHQA